MKKEVKLKAGQLSPALMNCSSPPSKPSTATRSISTRRENSSGTRSLCCRTPSCSSDCTYLTNHQVIVQADRRCGLQVVIAHLGYRQTEIHHLVHREIFPEVPPRVEYSLTETGRSLTPAITALIAWGQEYFDFVSNRIILDRESYDFGKPKWHLLEVMKVPSTYRGMRIVYKYDDGFHDDFKATIKREQSHACMDSAEREQFRTTFNVSEELTIEYHD